MATELERILLFLTPAPIFLLLYRLYRQRLLGVYKAFSCYLLFGLGQATGALLAGGPTTETYFRLYLILEPLAWIFSCWVLLELFDLTLADFPGVRSAGKAFLGIGIAVAAIIGTISAGSNLLTTTGVGRLLSLYMIAEQSVTLVNLVLLSALQILILYFRLSLPRNTLLYSIVYAISYGAHTGIQLVINSFMKQPGAWPNVISMTIDAACLVFLSVALAQSGTRRQAGVKSPHLTDADRAKMREQLNQVTELVSRIRR